MAKKNLVESESMFEMLDARRGLRDAAKELIVAKAHAAHRAVKSRLEAGLKFIVEYGDCFTDQADLIAYAKHVDSSLTGEHLSYLNTLWRYHEHAQNVCRLFVAGRADEGALKYAAGVVVKIRVKGSDVPVTFKDKDGSVIDRAAWIEYKKRTVNNLATAAEEHDRMLNRDDLVALVESEALKYLKRDDVIAAGVQMQAEDTAKRAVRSVLDPKRELVKPEGDEAKKATQDLLTGMIGDLVPEMILVSKKELETLKARVSQAEQLTSSMAVLLEIVEMGHIGPQYARKHESELETLKGIVPKANKAIIGWLSGDM